MQRRQLATHPMMEWAVSCLATQEVFYSHPCVLQGYGQGHVSKSNKMFGNVNSVFNHMMLVHSNMQSGLIFFFSSLYLPLLTSPSPLPSPPSLLSLFLFPYSSPSKSCWVVGRKKQKLVLKEHWFALFKHTFANPYKIQHHQPS